MTTSYNFPISLAIIIIFAFSCENTNNNKEKLTEKSITLFAASSLVDVISEMIDSFEIAHNVKIRLNTASSGTLARQIDNGASTDIYISANKKWFNYIDSVGYFISDSKSILAKNQLTLIAPINSRIQDSIFNLKKSLGAGRLSIGNPTHVPAGRYSKQALDYYNCYPETSKHVLKTKDVRSALIMVEMEEAQRGIVYRTDALKSDKVKIIYTFPATSHEPIEYIGGICSNNNTAKHFFSFIYSAKTKAIWEKHGFTPLAN